MSKELTIMPSTVYRIAVAAPVGTARCYLTITPSGGAAAVFGESVITTNGIGDNNQTNIGTEIHLTSGDQLDWSTADTSTGGQNRFGGGFLVNEFDA